MDEGEVFTYFFFRKYGIEEWVFFILNFEGVFVFDMSGICYLWMIFFFMLFTVCFIDSLV